MKGYTTFAFRSEHETKSLEHLLRFLDQVKCLLHENGVPQDFNRLSLSLSRAEENLEQRIADKVKESLEEQFCRLEGRLLQRIASRGDT